MVTYEVTFIGRPQGYQVTVNSPELKQAELVGDFSSLEAAEAFADNMRKIALAVTAIIWGTTAVASRHSQPEHLTMADTGPASWSISPAQLRMW